MDNVDSINLMITHTHSDHVGSIGTLIMYCYYVLNKKVNIIISKNSLYKDDIINLIKIFGCTDDMYQIINEEEFDDKYNSFNEIRFLKTNHVLQIPSYGIKFNTKNGIVYYSGDTSDLNNIENLIKNNIIDKIYVDSTSINSSNNVHAYIGDLNNLIPEQLKNKIYCIHINNEECIKMALKYGFNVVKFDKNTKL